MPWNLVEFIWRRKHYGDLWGGFLKCLKDVSVGGASDSPDLTEDLLQPGDTLEPEAPPSETEEETEVESSDNSLDNDSDYNE